MRVLHILYIQLGVVFCCSVLIALFSMRQLPSFLAGAVLITVNSILLEQLWSRVCHKKPVAMTIGIIVIKYTLLIGFLYNFLVKWRVDLIPFCTGLATIVGSVMIVGLLVQFSKRFNRF